PSTPVGRPIVLTVEWSATYHQSIGLLPGHAPFAGSSDPERTPMLRPFASATPVRSSSPTNCVSTLVVPALMPSVSDWLIWPSAVPVMDWVPRRLVVGLQKAGAAVPWIAIDVIRVMTSYLQFESQPSRLNVLPSSHCSPGSRTPLPHTAAVCVP